ncbi:hypothetical protein GGF49_002334 [Coemansia sp. RSA 1853]|nr:hypothetical protein GGF49_002334 [Coemansia sp. RSA 1853]
MQAQLGFSVEFFVPRCNMDFEHWDVLYPATHASIEERLHCQCTSLVLRGTLLCEYLGGCPLPATYAPIQPPMHDNVKLIFTMQHMLSEAAHDGHDHIIEERIQYGI